MVNLLVVAVAVDLLSTVAVKVSTVAVNVSTVAVKMLGKMFKIIFCCHERTCQLNHTLHSPFAISLQRNGKASHSPMANDR
jgi:hypothetical protein